MKRFLLQGHGHLVLVKDGGARLAMGMGKYGRKILIYLKVQFLTLYSLQSSCSFTMLNLYCTIKILVFLLCSVFSVARERSNFSEHTKHKFLESFDLLLSQKFTQLRKI